jgi:hypothetical protein
MGDFFEEVDNEKSVTNLTGYVIIILVSLGYLLFLNSTGQDPAYANTYLYLWILALAIVFFKLIKPDLPISFLTLGDPEEPFSIMGHEMPVSTPTGGLIVGAVASILFFGLGLIRPFLPFSIYGQGYIVPVSLGSAIMESTIFSGVLLPSFYALFLELGIIPFALVLIIFLIFFLSLNFIFVVLGVALILFILADVRALDIKTWLDSIVKWKGTALILAMICTLALFSSVHARGNVSDADFWNNRFFSVIADSLTVLTGGIVAAIFFHSVLNGISLATLAGLWWVAPILIIAYIQAYEKVLST